MNIPILEQETTINFSREFDDLILWTSDKTVMTKLDRMCSISPEYKLIDESIVENDVVAKRYSFSKDLLSFRKGKRTLSDEQRKALSQRAKQNFHK